MVGKESACHGDRNKKCSLASQRRNSHRKIISCQNASLRPVGSLGSPFALLGAWGLTTGHPPPALVSQLWLSLLFL